MAHKDYSFAAAWHPDGNLLATGERAGGGGAGREGGREGEGGGRGGKAVGVAEWLHLGFHG